MSYDGDAELRAARRLRRAARPRRPRRRAARRDRRAGGRGRRAAATAARRATRRSAPRRLVRRVLGGLLVGRRRPGGAWPAAVRARCSRATTRRSASARPGRASQVAARCPDARGDRDAAHDQRGTLSRRPAAARARARQRRARLPGTQPPAALRALQDELTGPFDPEIAAAGQAVILRAAAPAGVEALGLAPAASAPAPERSGAARRSPTPGSATARRSPADLTRWPADSHRCASRSPRSTPAWATSRATPQDPRAHRGARATRAPSSSLFPELAVTGYPPEDLLLKEHFLRARARGARRRSPPRRDGIVALVGFPERTEDVYNALAVLADGEVAGDLPQEHAARTTASSTSSATSRRATAAR